MAVGGPLGGGRWAPWCSRAGPSREQSQGPPAGETFLKHRLGMMQPPPADPLNEAGAQDPRGLHQNTIQDT